MKSFKEKKYNIQAVEIDQESVFYLRLNYPKLDIIASDFLKLNIEDTFSFNFCCIIILRNETFNLT